MEAQCAGRQKESWTRVLSDSHRGKRDAVKHRRCRSTSSPTRGPEGGRVVSLTPLHQTCNSRTHSCIYLLGYIHWTSVCET